MEVSHTIPPYSTNIAIIHDIRIQFIVKYTSSHMSKSVNKSIKHTETIEHQGWGALTGARYKKAVSISKSKIQ